MPMTQTTPQKIAKTPTTQTSSQGNSWMPKELRAAQHAKDPSTLPTFAERGTAIASKLERIKGNPSYQALSPDQKAKVREGLYVKYVVPSFHDFKLPVPDERTWVGATGRDIHAFGGKLSESYGGLAGDDFNKDLITGADKGLTKIGMFGMKVSNEAFSSLHGLWDHFTHASGINKGAASTPEWSVQKDMANAQERMGRQVQSDDFWLQTHPRTTVMGKLASDAGELIATLPLYEAIGAGRAAVGVKAFDSLSLTQKLAGSKAGMFVAKRLGEATDGYISSLIASGGDTKEATGGAVGFAAMGALGSVGAKIASVPLIKKWSANLIAMGGKPFAQDLMQSALDEEAGLIHSEGKLSHDLGMGIKIHPEDESKGAFEFGGKIIPYSNPAERQEAYDTIQAKAMQLRKENDPLLHKLHEGEKASLNSLSRSRFGKFVSGLDKSEIAELRSARLNSIEQAAYEAPVHVPDIQRQEIAASLQKQMQASPAMQEADKILQKYGVNTAKTVADNSIDKIAIETGIKDTRAVQRKLSQIQREASRIRPEKTLAEKKGAFTPASFAQLKNDSIAYLRSPSRRKEVADNIGERAGGNFKGFVDYLKSIDGGKLHFETDYQRLLFHHANRKELPEGVADKIYREARKIDPNITRTQLNREADWFQIHLLNMVHSGRLTSEGNLYRSTKLGAPMEWTKYQRQLSTEADKEKFKVILESTAKYPEVQKGLIAFQQRMSKLKMGASTPEEYLDIEKYVQEQAHKTARIVQTGVIE